VVFLLKNNKNLATEGFKGYF